MRDLPWLHKKWICLFILYAAMLGSIFDIHFGSEADTWIHDEALIFQPRKFWTYTAIVVLDDDIPLYVSRQQSLPLFARAAEVLTNAGVKGIFLDSRLSKEIETKMPYAQCIEKSGEIRWSMPLVSLNQQHKQYEVGNSPVGMAPLLMSAHAIDLFNLAPYQDGQTEQSDFLLYGDSEQYIPSAGLTKEVRLIKKDNNTAVARWMDLSEDHAVIALASRIDLIKTKASIKNEAQEICEQNRPCRRIRFSIPTLITQFSEDKPILPLSQLASCDLNIAKEAAKLLVNRVVIFQLVSPSEITDVHITPMTTAIWGPHLLTPGAQYIGDAIETILANDHPRAPNLLIKQALFLMSASIGVLASLYLRQQVWILVLGVLCLLLVCILCLYLKTIQLWPVTATILAFITGSLEGITLHLAIGLKEGHLIKLYMPQQVHNLLLPLKSNETFRNQRYNAVVLMSDLSGYTTVTSILKKPAQVLTLMNDYLNETSYILQEQFDGWLESYIGDMVCYYWPYKAKQKQLTYEKALNGALVLSQLQKKFFLTLNDRYQNQFDTDALQKINSIINAGIGLSAGEVIMGDLGPKHGVRKFGILGDPMNLTARIESLTRFFNTEIIITADFLRTATALGYPTRRLGRFRVKGRSRSTRLYALGTSDDPRFQSNHLNDWQQWLTAQERSYVSLTKCPHCFKKDQRAFERWKIQKFLQQGIWALDEK